MQVAIRQAQVVGVPRLRVVFGDISHRLVALAGVDEAVVHGPVAPVERGNHRAAVPRYVGNLTAIPLALRVGVVGGSLEGVAQAQVHIDRSKMPPALHRRINAAYLHVD